MAEGGLVCYTLRAMGLLQRMRSWKPRGVTMLELVLAMGLLFVSAGGVMTILMAGAGYPRRTQYLVVRDGLAKIKMDEVTSGAIPPTAGYPFVPITGNPDYEAKMDVDVSTFDPSASWVHVTVKGPKPYATETTLNAMMVKSVGASVFESYACNSCHTIGMGSSGTYPALNAASLARGLSERNTAGPGTLTMDQYISESVRDPDIFKVTDPTSSPPAPYTASMTAYPTTTDMPAADLVQLAAFLQSL